MGPHTPQPRSAGRLAPLRQALRLLLLRSAKHAIVPPSERTVAGLSILSLGLWFLLDRLQYGADAQFEPYGAPGFAWYVLGVLLAAWLISRTTRPQVELKSSLYLLVVVAPIALVTHYLLLSHGVVPALQKAAVWAVVAYLIVYAAVGLQAICGRPQIPAAAALVLLAALLTALDSSVAAYPTLWYHRAPDSAEAAATRYDKAEELLMSQPARISAAVSWIVPSAANTPSVYFVGFAGVGRQRVFAEEIKLAASRVAERYGSSQRSILLLNDRRDVNSHPLATVSGLTLALKGVASRMNLDQDVLFLALSSHGSAAPELSVSNGGLPLRDLTGSNLAAALKESGIKWKVIVISACHAGAFIDVLRDDNTIILTAAAADRTSFGCSDDRNLTYFGEAFYRDAFPRSTSIRDAFDRAKADIAAREQREGITPSQPQGFFGSALEKRLAAMDAPN